ncbi:MAG TPA: zf-HC2 domain-containing protein [Terriglobales bacterium]|nr:zf-HC2 domain-containing protein [Terriglobales bacterium]
MAHEQWQTQIDAYLDGELNAEAMHALDAHLRTCPACAADVLARVQLKRAVKTAGSRFTPSADFRSKIQKQIAAKPRRSWNFGWTMATATLALLLVAGAITTYIGRQNLHQQQVYSELADLHVATLGSPNPVDVVSSDRHTVKPWFQGKIPFTFNLPELQNSEFTLIGGRVAYLGQTSGAHLIYQIRKHQISVFMFPESAADSLGNSSRVERRQTFNAETWTQEGLRYVVFGDAAPEDIQSLSALLKSTAKS